MSKFGKLVNGADVPGGTGQHQPKLYIPFGLQGSGCVRAIRSITQGEEGWGALGKDEQLRCESYDAYTSHDAAQDSRAMSNAVKMARWTDGMVAGRDVWQEHN